MHGLMNKIKCFMNERQEESVFNFRRGWDKLVSLNKGGFSSHVSICDRND